MILNFNLCEVMYGCQHEIADRADCRAVCDVCACVVRSSGDFYVARWMDISGAVLRVFHRRKSVAFAAQSGLASGATAIQCGESKRLGQNHFSAAACPALCVADVHLA